MRIPPYIIFAAVVPLILIGLLLLLVVGPDGRASEHLSVGLLLGTIYAHVTLAASWNALGPFTLVVRLPLSLAWLGATAVSLLINFSMHQVPAEAAILVGGLAVAQWLLVQLPFWGLAVYYGLRVRHWSEKRLHLDAREHQFGIRQVMILTAIVAVVLGIGRVVVANLADWFENGHWDGEQVVVFAFLAIAAITMTVPLLLAALLDRFAWAATPIVLVLAALATAGEFPLLMQFTNGAGGGPDVWHLIFINAFSIGWVLLIAGLLRVGGYQLTTPSSAISKGVSKQ